jgi:hypothetical protein
MVRIRCNRPRPSVARVHLSLFLVLTDRLVSMEGRPDDISSNSEPAISNDGCFRTFLCGVRYAFSHSASCARQSDGRYIDAPIALLSLSLNLVKLPCLLLRKLMPQVQKQHRSLPRTVPTGRIRAQSQTWQRCAIHPLDRGQSTARNPPRRKLCLSFFHVGRIPNSSSVCIAGTARFAIRSE